MTTTRLLAITDRGCPASTRYRVSQFESALGLRSVSLETLDWPDRNSAGNGAAHEELLERVVRADVVIIQRYLPDSAALRRILSRARRLVYDFDDAVIYSESTRGTPHRKLRRSWRFRRMVSCCDAITAGNEYLAGLARRHVAPGRVHVVRTALEVAHYESGPQGLVTAAVGARLDASAFAIDGGSRPRSGQAPVIGWIGSRSTLPYLERLRGPLEELSRQIPGLKVHVISDRQANLGITPTEWIPWRLDTEVRELARLQVGLAPLPDDRWTRGKCGLRLLQYLAAGVPAVASPVGTQGEITAVDAALPATSDADWLRSIKAILSDRALAVRLTDRGKKLVRERFDVPILADSVHNIWCGSA